MLDGLFSIQYPVISIQYLLFLPSVPWWMLPIGDFMTAPKITYLVPSPHGYVLLNDTISRLPLRLTRQEPDLQEELSPNYADYFNRIADVISRDGYGPLALAAATQLDRNVSVRDIQEIVVYSEKHGSDYHPARVEVLAGDQRAIFVMNVAVTRRGKAWVSREFDVLQHLHSKYHYPFLPRTYFLGEASPPTMLMFLADWFQGYHEFHLSIHEEHGRQELLVWDAEKGRRWLSEPQAWETYRQAARILTLYYDLETFEQIFPWHHAAGDFVVKADQGSVDVKLVTARQYAPMVDSLEGVSVHDALLLFLLNLSLRMRLDRLDGVGSVAWSADDCVTATLEGFLSGLKTKEQQGIAPEGFTDGFLSHIRSLSKEALSEGFHTLVAAYDQTAPDMPVIRLHLERHISKTHASLQGLKNP